VPNTGLRRRKMAVLAEDGEDTQHHPWEMVVPVSSSGPGPQGVLQPPVEPLHQPFDCG
jgi:hypothetical protein